MIIFYFRWFVISLYYLQLIIYLDQINYLVNVDEYRIIQDCTTSKKAWDILEVMYDGTFVVKMSRSILLKKDNELI